MFFLFLFGERPKRNNPQPSRQKQKDEIMDINQLSSKIIGAAIEVHKALGPGLLESSYQKCLCHELCLRETSFEDEKPLALVYKGEELDCSYQRKTCRRQIVFCFPSSQRKAK